MRVLFAILLLLAAWFALCWGVWLVAGRRRVVDVSVVVFREGGRWSAIASGPDWLSRCDVRRSWTQRTATESVVELAMIFAVQRGIDPATLRFEVKEEAQ